ncbi:MAG TPA: hypothetical protein VF622_13830 [Segetibacter sp.]|jgi:hypothetical protein
MAITATNNGSKRELIEAGNYVARCYQMIEIGTVEETIQNQTKTQKKVRIGWELPTELKVFNEEKGEQPRVISKEFTLSLHEKSNLRKTLASWRGKDFTEEQAKAFDITVLVGVPCMLNIIHKPSKDGSKTYEEIGSISPMPKGYTCPDQINKTFVLGYDAFDQDLFDSLPDFIKDKMKTSEEFKSLQNPHETHMNGHSNEEPLDDLPF